MFRDAMKKKKHVHAEIRKHKQEADSRIASKGNAALAARQNIEQQQHDLATVREKQLREKEASLRAHEAEARKHELAARRARWPDEGAPNRTGDVRRPGLCV